MGLSKSTLQSNLHTKIYNELIRYSEQCRKQKESSGDVFEALIDEHANNLATIISTEVDDFVRSANVRGEKFDIAPSSIQTTGDASGQIGPASSVPLQSKTVTLGEMN